MIRLFTALLIGAALVFSAGCSTNKEGPTYPVVGAVSQTDMKKTADASRLTYFGLVNLAAEYASLPRCVPGGAGLCSAQSIVNRLRQYSNAADIATKGAQAIADSPTSSPLAIANAVSDGQRAIEVLRNAVAEVRPEAKGVK